MKLLSIAGGRAQTSVRMAPLALRAWIVRAGAATRPLISKGVIAGPVKMTVKAAKRPGSIAADPVMWAVWMGGPALWIPIASVVVVSEARALPKGFVSPVATAYSTAMNWGLIAAVIVFSVALETAPVW